MIQEYKIWRDSVLCMYLRVIKYYYHFDQKYVRLDDRRMLISIIQFTHLIKKIGQKVRTLWKYISINRILPYLLLPHSLSLPLFVFYLHFSIINKWNKWIAVFSFRAKSTSSSGFWWKRWNCNSSFCRSETWSHVVGYWW